MSRRISPPEKFSPPQQDAGRQLSAGIFLQRDPNKEECSVSSKKTFDPAAVRRDFPVLDREINGRPLIYLDNAATTQMPEQVLRIIAEQHRFYEANVHRGVHTLSEESTTRMEAARETARVFLNARETCEILFTSGTTGGINLAARAFQERFLRPGDNVIATEMEHHSNLIPWQEAARRSGAEFRVLPFTEDGELHLDLLDKLLDEHTKLVAVCGVSNVLGTVNPVREIADRAHAAGARVLVDGAQMVRCGADVQALGCDFFAFSGHKIMGPTGTGILYGKRELLEELQPVEFGGGMVGEVWADRATWGDLPYRFEAGTPNIVGNIALGASLSYFVSLPPDVQDYEVSLLRYTESALRALPEIEILGAPAHRSGVVSFNVRGAHCYDVASLLDKLGIAVRSGHHCAEPLLKAYGLTGCVRVSPAFYNTREEIDALIAGLKRIIPLLTGAGQG